MPINRSALIRHKTIDNCLQNRHRTWTIDDLRKACSDVLYEHDGKEDVSLRTIQSDIKHMRDENVGYGAPIIVVDKKYYTYAEKNFSITNMPLTANDIGVLSEIVGLLKQFEGFSQFRDMAKTLKTIEHKVFAINNPSRMIIDFEKINNIKGLNYLNLIYTAIKNETCLHIEYLPFHYTAPVCYVASPYLLKEYKNRWFLFAKRNDKGFIANIALDRITSISCAEDEPFEDDKHFNPEEYFRDIVGVTKHDTPVEKIIFWVEKSRVPYFETKPFHHSLELIEYKDDGAIFSIEVIINHEVKFELLGNADLLEVLEPEHLRIEFKDRIDKMRSEYEN